MHLHRVGRRALLVEVGDPGSALALAGWARERGVVAVEIVPAAETVLFDGLGDPEGLVAQLRDWVPAAAATAGGLVELPTTYDGPDLAAVAEAWGTDPEEVAAIHQGIEFVATFCGFAPGFSYLSGLPERYAVARLDSPRTRVPAGSVALAGTWCGVYPTASPGGWQLIGRTDRVLWDPSRDSPALLAPGTRVRFRAA